MVIKIKGIPANKPPGSWVPLLYIYKWNLRKLGYSVLQHGLPLTIILLSIKPLFIFLINYTVIKCHRKPKLTPLKHFVTPMVQIPVSMSSTSYLTKKAASYFLLAFLLEKLLKQNSCWFVFFLSSIWLTNYPLELIITTLNVIVSLEDNYQISVNSNLQIKELLGYTERSIITFDLLPGRR